MTMKLTTKKFHLVSKYANYPIWDDKQNIPLSFNCSNYFNSMVRPERLELSWAKPTRPSTVPVYQFQHGRNYASD